MATLKDWERYAQQKKSPIGRRAPSEAQRPPTTSAPPKPTASTASPFAATRSPNAMPVTAGVALGWSAGQALNGLEGLYDWSRARATDLMEGAGGVSDAFSKAYRSVRPETSIPETVRAQNPKALAPASSASFAPDFPGQIPGLKEAAQRAQSLPMPALPTVSPATTRSAHSSSASGSGLVSLIDSPQDRDAAQQRAQSLLQALPTLNAQAGMPRTGGSLVDVMPIGLDAGQRVTAQPSRSLGLGTLATPVLPGISAAPPEAPRGIGQWTHRGGQWSQTPSALQRPAATPSLSPLYQTDYTVYGQNGQQGTLSIQGANRRAGGGTLSVLDQGNGGTTEGNVAAINRQIAALRSLRGADDAALNPFSRPGDSEGAAQRRAAQYDDLIRQAMPGSGRFRGGRQSALEAANALIAPGLAAFRENSQRVMTPAQQAQQELGLRRLDMERQQSELATELKRQELGQTGDYRRLLAAKQAPVAKLATLDNVKAQWLHSLVLQANQVLADSAAPTEKKAEAAALLKQLREQMFNEKGLPTLD